LKAPNAGAVDNFGETVALAGDTLAVGAKYEDSCSSDDPSDDSCSGSGAVYVFVRSGTTWDLQQYLKASNPGIDDWFGESLVLDGQTLVTGASNEKSCSQTDQTDAGCYSAGAAYVFVRNGTTWSQQVAHRCVRRATHAGVKNAETAAPVGVYM